MNVGLNFRWDSGDFEREIRRIASHAVALDRMAEKARQIILERTREKGLDIHGVPFREYGTKRCWISKRHEPAPRRGGTPSGTGKSVRYEGGYREFKFTNIAPLVNLSGTSRMLSNLRFRREGDRRIFGFDIAEQNDKAYAHDQGEGQPRREFLGIGHVEGEEEELLRAYEEGLDE